MKVKLNCVRKWNDRSGRRSFAQVLAIATCCLCLPAFSVAAETRIGVIDLRKVFEEYHKTITANAKFKEQLIDLKKEENALIEQYQKAREEYKRALDDANDQVLSMEEREKRKKTAEAKLLDVQTMQQTIEDFNKAARTRLDEQERGLREKIMSEIRAVLGARAKAAGFTLVFDTAAETRNFTPVIPYFSGENDLTEAVLSELNANAPPAAKK